MRTCTSGGVCPSAPQLVTRARLDPAALAMTTTTPTTTQVRTAFPLTVVIFPEKETAPLAAAS